MYLQARKELVNRHEDVMEFVNQVHEFAWRTDRANSVADVRECLAGLDALLQAMSDVGLDLKDDVEHFLRRAHVANKDSSRLRVDWKAMYVLHTSHACLRGHARIALPDA